jgi:biopolymer transport protein ExbB/TolQ
VLLIPDVCNYWCGCGWGTGDIWYCWDPLERASAILIAVMAADSLIITCRRLYRNRKARRQTVAFRRDSAEAVRGGRLDEVIAVAAQNKQSPVARVVGASLIAFTSAPPELSNPDMIATAERAFQRSRRVFAAELRRGLSALNTIAACAVMIGLLGTCFGVGYAFRGAAMEKYTLMVRTNSDLARAVTITAMGLLVSVLAMLCRNFLRSEMELFESEMLNARLNLIAKLTVRNDQRLSERGADEAMRSLFVTPGNLAARSWEVQYDRQQPLSLAMGLYGLYIAFDMISRVVH